MATLDHWFLDKLRRDGIIISAPKGAKMKGHTRSSLKIQV